jgi:hypothetical protein
MDLTFTSVLTLMSIPSAFTGFCFWVIQKSINKKEEKRDEADKAREKNEILLIRSVGAAIALGEATAHAIRDGKCNGEMSAALEYAQKVKHEQKDFMSEQAVKNMF